MPVMIKCVKIENFRSIETLAVTLGRTNLIVGQNNSGKSNFLRALGVAMGNVSNIDENDIHHSIKYPRDDLSVATIDVMIIPVSEVGKRLFSFNSFWVSVFQDVWIVPDSNLGDYCGIRTEIKYDHVKSDYIIERRPITDWDQSTGEVKVFNKTQRLAVDFWKYVGVHYVDASRDAVLDLANKRSFLGKAASQHVLTKDQIESLEDKLDIVNDEILNSIPALTETSRRLSEERFVLGKSGGDIKIQPLSRKISDLHRGMDIVINEKNSETFSIKDQGMGTRSWISFMSFSSYVDWTIENIKIDDDEADIYSLLLLEEPESHLHPHAQRQLYSQITKFSGQTIISTHSQSIVSQAELDELIFFNKLNGMTTASSIDIKEISQPDRDRIKKEAIDSHGDLFFSNAIVLCEGITETQALPIFFEKYFGVNPTICGVQFVGVGGQNYGTFLKLIKYLQIPWFIFSDGETATIKTVVKAVNSINEPAHTIDSIKNCKNIVIIDNEDYYESYLINEGYDQEIEEAICEFKKDKNFIDKFIKKKDGTQYKQQKTDDVCKKCNQNIFEGKKREYAGDKGRKRALLDCATSLKSEISEMIPQKIIRNENRSIPSKLEELFEVINLELDLGGRYNDDTTV